MYTYQNASASADLQRLTSKSVAINYEYIALMLIILFVLIKSPKLFNLIRGAALTGLTRAETVSQSEQSIRTI